MSYLTDKKFSFMSTALDSETFAVVHFTGSEALSKPYEFEIMLVTEESDIDLNSVLQQPASFTFHRETGDDVIWNGIVAQFEQLHNFNLYTFYRVVLVPKLWWLQLTHHNQVFLDKTVKEIIELVLQDAGLTTMDFEFKLQNDYSPFDYVCQYEESHYDFISRWMEREGLYYYFEQTENGEKVIITDTKAAHTGMSLGDTLFYNPPSGLAAMHRTEIIQSFTCRQKLTPNKVFLKDYNYETPSLSVSGNADVDPGGRGDVYYYGENFKNSTDGNRLARIRSEEILCRKEQYIGESTVPFIMPGYSFTLEDHYRADFNNEYLTISVDFSGSQTGYLISGIKQALSEMEEKVYYSNTFTAIPYEVQFRTERRTKKSKIYGTLPAKIDAAGSGEYAELDSQGRYKVVMPFDESGRQNGRASIWLRMVQPYAGSGHGMHFPLHKGTEVMIVFTDGDPDRPIIAGAVPNPETSSMVNVNNQTQSVIQTGGANRIAIEDNAGSERILLHSPRQSSYVRIGIHNDPPEGGEIAPEPEEPEPQLKPEPPEEPEEPEEPTPGGNNGGSGGDMNGIALVTHDFLKINANFKNEVILGWSGSYVTPLELTGVLGLSIEHLVNPAGVFRKGTGWAKNWGALLTALPVVNLATILPDLIVEMNNRGYSWGDAIKFFLRLCKIEVMVGNEFSYKIGDKIELSDGEFKRNTKEEIEHRSDKEVISICDGGDSAEPPNRLHHNVKVDPDEVSMYGKKVHLRSNDTGMADIEGEGADQKHVEQDPIRQIILSKEDGINIEFKSDQRDFGKVQVNADQITIQVRQGMPKTSSIEIRPDTIDIRGKKEVKINHFTIDQTDFTAANGALKVQAGKVMLG